MSECDPLIMTVIVFTSPYINVVLMVKGEIYMYDISDSMIATT